MAKLPAGLALYGDLKTPAPDSKDLPLEVQDMEDELSTLLLSKQELEKKVKTLQARDQAARRIHEEVLTCATDFEKNREADEAPVF